MKGACDSQQDIAQGCISDVHTTTRSYNSCYNINLLNLQHKVQKPRNRIAYPGAVFTRWREERDDDGGCICILIDLQFMH